MRIARLDQVAGYMDDSIAELSKGGGSDQEIADQRAFAERWPGCERSLKDYQAQGQRDSAGYLRFCAGRRHGQQQQAAATSTWWVGSTKTPAARGLPGWRGS
jgi:hypothetical protein